jgi:hypothetical protein
MPVGRRQTTRIPYGPSSAASCRVKLSTAAPAMPKLPEEAAGMRAIGTDRGMITPDPCRIMCRAAAFAVRKWVRA